MLPRWKWINPSKMTPVAQMPLPLFPVEKSDPNVAYLVGVLQGRDWTTAREIIAIVMEQTQVKWHDRKVRELASLSKGQVAGGQQGYKLVEKLTLEEFTHAANWMRSQSREMDQRVVDMSRVFYGRNPGAARNGIL